MSTLVAVVAAGPWPVRAGAQSKRVPRRAPACTAPQWGTVVGHLLWLLASRFEIFVLSRAGGGATRALVQLSTAIVADVTAPNQRTRGMVS